MLATVYSEQNDLEGVNDFDKEMESDDDFRYKAGGY